jgi:hypothetical protein
MKNTNGFDSTLYKIEPNPIYLAFQSQILHGFRQLPQFDYNRALSKDQKFSYYLKDDEYLFHQNVYVPFGKYISDNSFFSTYFPDRATDEIKIDNIEYDLITHLLSSTQLFLIKAPIGRGKSTFLQHVILYTCQQSETLKKRILPIIIPVDQKDILSKPSNLGREEILTRFHNEILTDTMNHYLADYSYELDNPEFWEYIQNSEHFSGLKMLKNYLSIKDESILKNPQQFNLWAKDFFEISHNYNFSLSFFEYLIDKVGLIPLIIYENFDELDMEKQKWLFSDIVEISQNHKFKVILPIRPVNYYHLRRNIEALNDYPIHEIDLAPLKIEFFIKNRIEEINREVEGIDQKVEIEVENIKFSVAKGQLALNAMLNVLTNEEACTFIAKITNNNLRKVLDQLKIYISSGYIRDWKLYKKILAGIVDQSDFQEYKNTLWVVLRSIITGNHVTHFSDREKSPNVATLETIVNLFCNNNSVGDYEENKFLIRLQLLTFIAKNPKKNYQEIAEKYDKLFIVQNENRKDCINRALYRLIQGQLIETVDKIMYKNVSEVVHAREVTVTETGYFYLDTFRHYFEYLLYMKDDIDLPEGISIKSNLVMNSFSELWTEVIKLLEILLNYEQSFLRNLNTLSKRKNFVEDFILDNQPISYFLSTMERLETVYAGKRELDTEKLKVLIDQSKKFQNTFLPSES